MQNDRSELPMQSVVRSGRTRPADESGSVRSAHEILAELKSKATQLKDDAHCGASVAHGLGDDWDREQFVARGIYGACLEFIRWIDEFSGCQAEMQCEAGTSTTGPT